MADVAMQMGTIGVQEGGLRVLGTIYPGGVVRGLGGIEVHGHVSGSLAHRCMVEVGGDVVVRGNVQGAHIRCRSLKVGGNVEHTEVLSDRSVEMGGDLACSEIQVGMCGHEYAELKALERQLSVQVAELNGLEGRIRLASRRMVREYGSIDMEFGNVITKGHGGVEIDLKDIYRVLRGRSQEEVDQGVREFYVKVIVGALTRANRVYITQNPNRQNIFLKLISELRDYVGEVRVRDRLLNRIQSIEDQRRKANELLNAPMPWSVTIGGQVKPETTFRLVQFRGSSQGAEALPASDPHIRAPSVSPPLPSREAEASVGLERRAAHLRVISLEGCELDVSLTSLDGTSSSKRSVYQMELASVRVLLKDGLPIWEDLQNDDMVKSALAQWPPYEASSLAISG